MYFWHLHNNYVYGLLATAACAEKLKQTTLAFRPGQKVH